jgi:hypothetical protein
VICDTRFVNKGLREGKDVLIALIGISLVVKLGIEMTIVVEKAQEGMRWSVLWRSDGNCGKRNAILTCNSTRKIQMKIGRKRLTRKGRCDVGNLTKSEVKMEISNLEPKGKGEGK